MDLTSIFCAIDDYCTQQKINWNGKKLSPVVRKRNRKFQLSLSEVATIVVYFHLSHYIEFKNYLITMNSNSISSNPPTQKHHNRLQIVGDKFAIIFKIIPIIRLMT